ATTMMIGPAIGLLFLTLTAIILIVDLERPERFYYILVRPNWRSWMVWGAYFLTAQGAIGAAWLAAAWFRLDNVLAVLAWPAVVSSVLATCYTGLLFAQGLARDLWQGPHATIDLLAQAIAEGSAVLLLANLFRGATVDAPTRTLAIVLLAALVAHLTMIVFENLLTPSATRHHELAVSTIRRGPFARMFWGGALGASVLAATIVAAGFVGHESPGFLLEAAGILALAGTFAWEYIWVEAGQSVPLS